MYHNNCIFLLFLCGKNLFAEMLMSCFAAAAQYHDFSSSGGNRTLPKMKVCRGVLSLRAADTAAAQYHDFSSSGGSDLLLIEYLCVKHLAFAFRQWLAANR
jgi:hypothetical protein